MTHLTAAAKLAAIVALLGDEDEDVNGADFIDAVSQITDAPTAPDPVAVTLRALVTSEAYEHAAHLSPWFRSQRAAALKLLDRGAR